MPHSDRLSHQISERPLFLNVEGLAGHDLTARFLVDGSPWLVETFRVPAADTATVTAKSCAELEGDRSIERPTRVLPVGTHVVELLARQPEALARLRELALKSPDRVRVELLQDGEVARSVPFRKLRAQSEALRHQPMYPQPVDSTVGGPGLAEKAQPAVTLAPKTTCEELCLTEYQDCIFNECGGQIICDTCEIQYQDCLDQCPPPPPPPPPTCDETVEYYYSTYLYGVYPTGLSDCFPDPWGYYDGVWHDEYAYVYRTDYIEKTTHTDCSVTTRVVSYSYGYYYCYDWTLSPCYNPWYPWNLCY